MRAEIISVGTELLLGDIVNTNAQYLAQELAALGFAVYHQTTVGDNALRLRSVVQQAKERSDVLILTGGLGPTADDLTKETIADIYGDSLVMDPDELAKLEGFFKKLGRTMTENNKKQALVPVRGHKLPNAQGTAPGCFFRQGDKMAFLLPGPPREMKPMFEGEVRPALQQMQEGAIRSLTLRVFGVGESDLETRVATLLEGSNPTAALYAKTGEVHIRITARAGNADAADAMCAEYAGLFRKALGDVIYSDNGDDLETTVVRALAGAGETVATAESCTGGMLAERITSVPGASGVFEYGAVSYANEVKHQALGVRNATLREKGAVSSEVAAEMAFGAAKRGAADFGVGITGVAGPDGGTPEKPVGLVYVAMAAGREVFVKKLSLAARDRDYVRHLATSHALDMVRRAVKALPIADAKRFTKNQHAEYERAGKPRRRGGIVTRILAALLAVAVLFGLLFGGLWLSRQNRGQATGGVVTPSGQNLQYGSAEYTAAACALVEQMSAENPSVVGYLAMPGGLLEQFVAKGRARQSALQNPDGTPDADGLALMGGDAQPAKTAANTLLLGGEGLSPLAALAEVQQVGNISTFTYYTARDARVYEIFAVYLLDGDEAQADGFDPAALSLSAYSDYLTFALGSKARSLFSVPVALEGEDSYMTLAAEDASTPGRRAYVCGRLASREALQKAPSAVVAPEPLMPAAWYAASGKRAPDANEVYAYWLRWYLARGVTNPGLQVAAGVPSADAAPPWPTPLAVASSSSQPQSAAEGASESASGGESSSDGDGSSGSGTGGSESSSPESASNAGSGSSASSSESSGSPGASGVSSETAGGTSSESGLPSAPSSSPAPCTAPPDVTKRYDPLYLTVTMNGERVRDTAAVILAQICQAEVPGAPVEVVKAQAIAAHSWILNQQGAGVAAPAVVGETPTAQVRAAVEEVAELVLSANGTAPAYTPYCKMAALATNTPADLWGVSRAYLPSVALPHEQSLTDWRRVVKVPRAEVAQMAMERLGVDLENIGDAATWFAGLEKNAGGYVKTLQVGALEVSGLEFWQKLLLDLEGRPLLKSPAFDVSFDGKAFVFTTYGEGHGCGMSQAGAAGLAREGKGYGDILAAYYPGCTLLAWE